MGLRRLIRHNFWAKFLSFVLAFLIWLSIYTSERGEAQAAGEEGTIPVAEETGGVLPNSPVAPLTPTPKKAAIEKSKPFTRPVYVLREPGDKFEYQLEPAEVEIVVQGEQLGDIQTKEVSVYVDITRDLARLEAARPESGIAARIEVRAPEALSVASVEPKGVIVRRVPPPPPPAPPPPPPEPAKKTEQIELKSALPDLASETNAVDAVKQSVGTNAPATPPDGGPARKVDSTNSSDSESPDGSEREKGETEQN